MTLPSHPVTLSVPPEATDHTHGAALARVTVVEYGDFECPSCKMASQTSTLLLGRFPGKVRFIFRHFPVPEAHPHAMLAAEASEAAAVQGKFWEMHDALFADQAHLTEEDLRAHASAIGLDMARYTAEMKDHVYLQKVQEQIEGAKRSHIRATPTFFLDGVVQDVSFGLQSLHDAVAAATL